MHWQERRGNTAEQQLSASLPTSPHDCLSVSSASLPSYTLSHFSPMSLPDPEEGKRKREEIKREEKGRKKRED